MDGGITCGAAGARTPWCAAVGSILCVDEDAACYARVATSTSGYAGSCSNALLASCGASCYPAACAVAGEALVQFLFSGDIGDERILSESYQATIPGKLASAMRIEVGRVVMLSVVSGSVVVTLKILPAVSAAAATTAEALRVLDAIAATRAGAAHIFGADIGLTCAVRCYELQKAPAGYTALVEPGSPSPGQTPAPAAAADEYDGDGLAWLVVVLCILVVAWVVAGYLFAAPCWGPARERLHVRRRPWQLACFCGMEPSFLDDALETERRKQIRGRPAELPGQWKPWSDAEATLPPGPEPQPGFSSGTLAAAGVI